MICGRALFLGVRDLNLSCSKVSKALILGDVHDMSVDRYLTWYGAIVVLLQ